MRSFALLALALAGTIPAGFSAPLEVRDDAISSMVAARQSVDPQAAASFMVGFMKDLNSLATSMGLPDLMTSSPKQRRELLDVIARQLDADAETDDVDTNFPGYDGDEIEERDLDAPQAEEEDDTRDVETNFPGYDGDEIDQRDVVELFDRDAVNAYVKRIVLARQAAAANTTATGTAAAAAATGANSGLNSAIGFFGNLISSIVGLFTGGAKL